MQSSYSLIKKERALDGEVKHVSTQLSDLVQIKHQEVEAKQIEEKPNEEVSYKEVADKIIEHARSEAGSILLEAKMRAAVTEKEAYEKGYSQGKQNGLEDAEKQVSEVIIPQAEAKAQQIVKDAEDMMMSAKAKYNEYMNMKEKDVVNVALTIAKKIMRKVSLEEDGISNIIDDEFNNISNEKNIIIYCNSAHIEELEEKKEMLKTKSNITGEIIIVKNNSIQPGNVIIQKENGKIEAGIDIGLEKMKEAILN